MGTQILTEGDYVWHNCCLRGVDDNVIQSNSLIIKTE